MRGDQPPRASQQADGGSPSRHRTVTSDPTTVAFSQTSQASDLQPVVPHGLVKEFELPHSFPKSHESLSHDGVAFVVDS